MQVHMACVVMTFLFSAHHVVGCAGDVDIDLVLRRAEVGGVPQRIGRQQPR